MSEVTNMNNQFLRDIRGIIDTARAQAVRSVDFCRVQMYWHMGKRIFEEEQQGKDRADYGTYLIKNLAKQLEPEYGSGFSYRQLAFCHQFYRLYPIVNALRSQLNWTQYRMLIQIDDPDKREYYELEAVNNAWTGRELERQIHSLLYERLLLSNDKKAVLAVARKERIPQSPLEIIKDPNKNTVSAGGRTLLRKLAEAGVIRAGQADLLAERMAREARPTTIICGDFNDIPVSYTHRVVQGDRRDAYVDAGSGPGISYNQNKFYFRIDNILYSGALRALRCRVDNSIKDSDHYPIYAYLSLENR